VGDAVGDDAGFTRAGSGEDKDRPGSRSDRLVLGRVQTFKDRHLGLEMILTEALLGSFLCAFGMRDDSEYYEHVTFAITKESNEIVNRGHACGNDFGIEIF